MRPPAVFRPRRPLARRPPIARAPSPSFTPGYTIGQGDRDTRFIPVTLSILSKVVRPPGRESCCTSVLRANPRVVHTDGQPIPCMEAVRARATDAHATNGGA